MVMRKIVQQAGFLNRIGNFDSFKLLLDTFPDTAFYIKDTKGRVVLFNRRSCEIYNVHHESEILGKTDYDLHPKALADKYTSDDRRVMQTRKPIINATELAPNNSNHLVVYSKVPVFDRQRKVIGVAGVYRFVSAISDAPGWYGRLSDAVNYIHANYAQTIRTEDLVRRTGLSLRQLEWRFKKVFGAAIVDYIQRVRIDAAREILETSDRTVSDIALTVGFYDHSHFIRVFKRLCGCSPKQYRASRLGGSKE